MNSKERIDWLVAHRIWTSEMHPREDWSEESKRRYVTMVGQDPPDVAYRRHYLDCVEIEHGWDGEKFQVYLSAGPVTEVDYGGQRSFKPTIDPDLICSGDSLEQALLKLADLVEEHYHEDGTKKEK